MDRATVTLILFAASLAAAPAPVLLAQGDAPSRESLQALEDFARIAREAMERLQGAVDPWVGPLSLYLSAPQDFMPPEILPGGDIIIRRRAITPNPPGPALDL